MDPNKTRTNADSLITSPSLKAALPAVLPQLFVLPLKHQAHFFQMIYSSAAQTLAVPAPAAGAHTASAPLLVPSRITGSTHCSH